MLGIVLLHLVMSNLMRHREKDGDERICDVASLDRFVMPGKVVAEVEPDSASAVEGDGGPRNINEDLCTKVKRQSTLFQSEHLARNKYRLPALTCMLCGSRPKMAPTGR